MTNDELPGMPPAPDMPKHDGVAFPTARLALAGGIDLELRSQSVIDYVLGFELEHEFDLRVQGEVTAKNWVTRRDKDGVPIRVLKVTLSVETIRNSDGVNLELALRDE